MNKAYVLKTDGTRQDLDQRPSLEEAQQIVGGWIELVNVRGTNLTLVVDEEGRLKNKPSNYQASALAPMYPQLCGDVIVLEGWRTVG